MQNTLTPKDLRLELEQIIDDEKDIDFEYSLLNQAKNLIESELKPLILQAGDSSQFTANGDTFTTLKLVPADFKSMIALFVGNLPFFETPFANRIQNRLLARRFYIDYKKMVQGVACLGLCGVQQGVNALNMTYLVRTPSITQTNEDTAGAILWPDEYQHAIPYRAAKILQANNDADDIAFRMSAQQEAEYQRIFDNFLDWDAGLKIQAMGNRTGFAPEEWCNDENASPNWVGLL